MPHNIHPAGFHNAIVVDHGFVTSSKGNTQLSVQFNTEYGAIRGWFALTPKAAQYTMEKIRAMGFQGGDLGKLADGNILEGNQCTLQINHEQDPNGKMRARVGFVNRLGERGGAAVEYDNAAAANAQRFNALLKKTPVAPVSKGKATNTSDTSQDSYGPGWDKADEPPFADDDDMPFD